MANDKINYNGISIEVKEITPELAKDILDNHNNLNRNRNKDHVKALLNNMKQGTSIDGFRYTLEVAAGYYDEFYSVTRKEWIQKPKSIAFDKMSEAEFDKLYEAVLDVIFKLFSKQTELTEIHFIEH